jgi:hypothetical protein
MNYIKTKKAMTILSTLLALVLTVVLVFVALKMATSLGKPDINNQDKLEQFKLTIDALNEIKELPKNQEEQNELFHGVSFLKDESVQTQVVFTSHIDELFFFFSSGKEDIRLVNTNDNIKPDSEYYSLFTFKKPSVCGSKACVCYCRDGPYWFRDQTKTQQLSPQKIIEYKEYVCPQPFCETFEEVIIFTNQRGSLSDNAINSFVDKADSKDIFLPISLDIVTIIQPNIFVAYSVQDLFFEKGYNRKEQDKNVISALLNSYAWEGGVVVGGTGFAKFSNQLKNGVLEGPVLNVLLEKSFIKEGENHIGENVIGVGLSFDPLAKNEEVIISAQRKADSLRCVLEKEKLLTELLEILESSSFKQSLVVGVQETQESLEAFSRFSLAFGNFLRNEKILLLENSGVSATTIFNPCYTQAYVTRPSTNQQPLNLTLEILVLKKDKNNNILTNKYGYPESDLYETKTIVIPFYTGYYKQKIGTAFSGDIEYVTLPSSTYDSITAVILASNYNITTKEFYYRLATPDTFDGVNSAKYTLVKRLRDNGLSLDFDIVRV